MVSSGYVRGRILLQMPSTQGYGVKKMRRSIEMITSRTAPTRTASGLILIPWASSSKKRRRPALETGIGDSFFLFFWLNGSPQFLMFIPIMGLKYVIPMFLS